MRVLLVFFRCVFFHRASHRLEVIYEDWYGTTYYRTACDRCEPAPKGKE